MGVAPMSSVFGLIWSAFRTPILIGAVIVAAIVLSNLL